MTIDEERIADMDAEIAYGKRMRREAVGGWSWI